MEVLQNVYTDCTRLDEALKKGEAIHAKETESIKINSCQKTGTDKYSDNENADTSGADWSNYDYFTGYSGYDYGQAWNYSQYQTEECGSTKDPYRENLASKTEAPSDHSRTSYRQSSDPDSTESQSSEALPNIDRASSEFVPTSKQ